MTRKRLFEIIEVSKDDDRISTIYDTFMLVVIICSLIPLAFKTTNVVFDAIETFATIVFVIDYILRWFTADYKLERGAISFVIYPFTPSAIIDLLAVLPSFRILSNSFRVLKIFRLFRVLRVLRVLRIFKAFRYSKSIDIVVKVIKREKNALTAVALLATGYVLICALVIFNVEPATFDNYFRAVYWATVSLTTVGYGDIYPVSTAGQIITMLSSVVGIAIVALPAGIITAGYMKEVSRNEDDDDSQETS